MTVVELFDMQWLLVVPNAHTKKQDLMSILLVTNNIG